MSKYINIANNSLHFYVKLFHNPMYNETGYTAMKMVIILVTRQLRCMIYK